MNLLPVSSAPRRFLDGGAEAESAVGRPRRRTRALSRSAGFTLIEVLVSVFIGGALVVAVVMFAFSMSELWGNGSEVRLFDQHVRGVARFLDNLVRQAEPPPAEPQTGVQNSPGAAEEAAANANPEAAQERPSATELPIVWQKARGREFGSEEYLTFEVRESPGVLPWPEQPLPSVVCALRLDPRRGLFLLWKSRLEVDFETDSPREMRVSPYVTAMSYLYYDTTSNNPRWETMDRPRTVGAGEREVPQRLRLTFEYQGESRTADIVLPGIAQGAPVY